LSEFVIKVLRRFGVNRAVGYGVLTRVWGALAGPVTILLIATRFSKVEQGYYYTFSSLLALQIFFELGLLTVMAQFAAHEFAFLSWGEGGEVRGPELNRERFLDLLYKGVRWYAVSALLLVALLIPAGLYFFGLKQGSGVDFSWRLPWAVAVIGVAGNLLVIPFNAVITGSGEVAFTNRQQMLGGILGSLLSWLIITLGGGLYAVPAVSFGTLALGALFICRGKPGLVRSVRERRQDRRAPRRGIDWRSEVWPMQWKIALSWMSGYFIFQLFTPVLFHFHGPVVAGQMGMTLSATNALLAVGLTWINAANPEFCKLIAVERWRELDARFAKVMGQTLSIALAGSLAGWSAIWFLHYRLPKVGERFLSSTEAGILIATVAVNVAIYGFATYLRAHKKEPLMLQALTAAVLQGSVTFFAGKYLASFGVTTGYLSVSLLFGLPSVAFIWSKCRTKWHQPERESNQCLTTSSSP
jgi:hypothetical protein